MLLLMRLVGRRCSRGCVRRRPDRLWEGGLGDRSTDASIPKTFGQMAAHGRSKWRLQKRGSGKEKVGLS